MFESIEIKEVKIEVGRLMKTIRKQRQLTQLEVSEQLGVSRNTIQNMESGKNFTINTLFKILKEFDLLDKLYREVLSERKAIEQTKSLY